MKDEDLKEQQAPIVTKNEHNAFHALQAPIMPKNL